MRCFLGVNKYAPIAGIEGDMGWITPDVRHKLAILRYWNKILDMTDNRISKIIFNYLRETMKAGQNKHMIFLHR